METEEVTQVPEFAPKKDRTFQRIKRRLLKHVWLVRIGLVTSIFLGVYLFFALTGFVFEKVGLTNYTEVITNFIFAPTSKIESVGGRTNILILGKGGQGHEASNLTDSIIFASVSHPNSGISLFSLPRDIWIPAIRAKINSAYYWGKQKEEGGGLILAKSTVEEIVGVPVHYGMVVDFSGFIKIVDVVGGVEVDVERGFVDEKYPIPGRENDLCDGDPVFACRYETIKFEEGKQVMNGDTALKFVRSRNAEGREGTDLARAARQQKVLLAIRQKVLTPGVLVSPKKLLAIWNVVKDSVETDISASQGAILLRRALAGRGKFQTYVLDEELLTNPPISPRWDNQYVFIPKAGDWGQIHSWVSQRLP
jgi:LCP family protein required for cell wall assembly